MNKYDFAKEAIYNALWELCEYDDAVYQAACNGNGREAIMDELVNIAARLNGMSQSIKR